MAEEPESQLEIIDASFNAEDADLVLVCSRPSQTDAQSLLHIFKVHRKVLAIPSTFFEDMFIVSVESSAMSQEQLVQGLPSVHMEEDVDVIRVLLGSAYNNFDLLIPMLEGDWSFALQVWEAANKYLFHVLRALASSKIQ